MNCSPYFIDAALSIRIGDPSLIELALGVVGSSFKTVLPVELTSDLFIDF